MPSPTPRCSNYWKGSLLVALDYGRHLYFLLYIYIYIYPTPLLQARSDTKSFFSRIYLVCIQQIALSRIWIQADYSISCDDNRFANFWLLSKPKRLFCWKDIQTWLKVWYYVLSMHDRSLKINKFLRIQVGLTWKILSCNLCVWEYFQHMNRLNLCL